MQSPRFSVRIPRRLNKVILVCAALFSPTAVLADIITTGDTSIGADTYFGDITTGIMKVAAEFGGSNNLSGSLVINGGSVLTSKDAVPTPGVPSLSTEPEPGGMIGRGPGSVGTATVTGINSTTKAASTWRLEGLGEDPGITFGPFLNVGREGGHGELNVTAGGKVILDGLGEKDLGSDFGASISVGRDLGSDGSVLNISGPGSEVIMDNIDHTYFRMGNRRETSTAGIFGNVDGEVNITDDGKLTVRGDNSLTVLRNGTANINTGGSLETTIMNIGDIQNTSATLNLDGNTSLAGNTSSIHLTGVGDADNDYSNTGYGGFMTIGGRVGSEATVNITNGAKIIIDDGDIVGGPGVAHDGTVSRGAGFSLGGNSALGFGGEGTLNVDGPGSEVNLSTANGVGFVGIGRTQGGGGTINLTNGGQIIVENNDFDEGVFMATSADSGTAVLNVDGATSLFDAGKILRVGVDGSFANTAKADINLTNGGVVKADLILVGNHGTITGSGSLVGNVLMNRGSIIPGNSPGTLTIDGDFEMIDGVLEIEVGGLATNQFDFLDIKGKANITGGTILLSFIDGYVPDKDDTFSFLTTDSLTIEPDVKFDYQGVEDSFLFNIAVGEGLKFTAVNDAVALPSTGVVPVPAAIWLFLSAIGLLGFLQKRKGNLISSGEEPVAA
jgi:hypothetical protein